MPKASLSEKLRGWFADDDSSSSPAESRRAPVESHRELVDTALPRDAESTLSLERRLKDLLTHPQLLSAGRIHLINFANLRKRLGDSWPRLRDRVHAAADRLINQAIGPRDVQFRNGDGEYIIVFAALNRQAATLVCAKVAEELHRLFLGEPELSEVTISTAVGVVDGRLLYEEVSAADLLRELERERQVPSESAAPPPEAARDGAGVSATTPAEPRKLQLASQAFERIDTMFRPVWDVRRQVISTYMCTPVRLFPDGTSVEGVAALASISDPQRLAAADMDFLTNTVETLDELFCNKFRLMVSVPVCFETLAARRSRQEYIGLCQSVPTYLRQFLSFEFLRFPDGVPNGRMTELVNELRPFGRRTFLRVDVRQPNFTLLVGTGLTGVSTLVNADRGAEARTMEELNSFVAAAERAGLQSCVAGITSTSLAIAARAAGFTFIAGDRVGRTEEVPQHMLHFGWQDLFLRGSKRPG